MPDTGFAIKRRRKSLTPAQKCRTNAGWARKQSKKTRHGGYAGGITVAGRYAPNNWMVALLFRDPNLFCGCCCCQVSRSSTQAAILRTRPLDVRLEVIELS